MEVSSSAFLLWQVSLYPSFCFFSFGGSGFPSNFSVLLDLKIVVDFFQFRFLLVMMEW